MPYPAFIPPDEPSPLVQYVFQVPQWVSTWLFGALEELLEPQNWPDVDADGQSESATAFSYLIDAVHEAYITVPED